MANVWYSATDLLDESKNLQASADNLEYCLGLCGGNYQCAFGCYNAGPRKGANSWYAKNMNAKYENCLEEGQQNP